jgi:hypothetical protein
MAKSQRTAASACTRALALAPLIAVALSSSLASAGPESPPGAILRPGSDEVAPRFTVHGSALLVPRLDSPDGRFAVIPAAVPDTGCDPGPDDLFSDGFE